MGYGRLGSSELGSSRHYPDSTAVAHATSPRPRNSKLKFLFIFAATLIVACGVSVAVLVALRNKATGDDNTDLPSHRKPSQAMSQVCRKTRFPSLCVDSLLDFPGSTTASNTDLVHISVNMTLHHFGRALSASAEINNLQMDTRARAAYDDCLELLEHSVDQLSMSLTSVAPPPNRRSQPVGSTADVMTWLSAALTNQDTCAEGFADVKGDVKDQMVDRLKDLSELVSNCLAIFAATNGDDFSGIPIQNRRRLLEESPAAREFPEWLSRRERRLLQSPVTAIQADIIVSKDGNGTYKTIAAAIKKAPEYGTRRFIIYVKAGK